MCPIPATDRRFRAQDDQVAEAHKWSQITQFGVPCSAGKEYLGTFVHALEAVPKTVTVRLEIGHVEAVLSSHLSEIRTQISSSCFSKSLITSGRL